MIKQSDLVWVNKLITKEVSNNVHDFVKSSSKHLPNILK